LGAKGKVLRGLKSLRSRNVPFANRKAEREGREGKDEEKRKRGGR